MRSILAATLMMAAFAEVEMQRPSRRVSEKADDSSHICKNCYKYPEKKYCKFAKKAIKASTPACKLFIETD